jgi:hypothetical protein
MPMSTVIPPNAAGFYVVIRPTVFWNSAFLDGDYTELGAKMVRETPASRDQMLQAAVEMLIEGSIRAIHPDIQQLPLEHKERQGALWVNKLGASLFAYLMQVKFFVLVLDDEGSDTTRVKFEELSARNIPEAQKLIMARADVQEIDRHMAVSWEPTVVH